MNINISTIYLNVTVRKDRAMIKKYVQFSKRFINRHNKKLKVKMKNLDGSIKNVKLASIITILIIFAIIGTYINTGLGTVVDCIIAIIIGVSVLLLIMSLIKVIFKALAYFPKKISAVLISTIIVLTIIVESLLYLPLWQAIICSSLIGIVQASIAICIWKLKQKGIRKISALIILFIAITINLYWGMWAFTNVDLSFSNDNEQNITSNVQAVFKSDMDLTSLMKPGAYSVESLTYGSGDDKRAQFGKGATLTSKAVSANSMLSDMSGFKGKMRKLFWGFDEYEYPLNGTVWYPKEKGQYPLVLIVHGNHTMEDYSDSGYAYLGELLASQGFITVSVDENFLNGSWSGDIGNENDARAWLLLKHLELFEKWNESINNVFHKKIDMDNIALVGHSRGGEAVSTAAMFNKLTYYPNDANISFDFHFNIKAVVAIAPTDGQYKPSGKLTPLENINYMVIQGSQDGDVSSFYGDLQYNRVEFTDDKYYFKTSLYIEGANHGQFNTTWGNKDLGGPGGLFLNIKPMLKGGAQRDIAKIYISAFLKDTLYNKKEYTRLFQNHGYMQNILPKTKYINRFNDSNYSSIANYEEDVDLTTGTLPGVVLKGEGFNFWREKSMLLRNEEVKNNAGVVLKWKNAGNHGPTYSVKLPSNLAKEEFDKSTVLTFSLADTANEEIPYTNKENIDLTIQIKDKNGLSSEIALSEVGILNPAIKVKFTKWPLLESIYDNEVEINLQSFQIPIEEFTVKNSEIKPTNIEYINFIFNKTTEGEILLDDIGLCH
jgi:dienelactone hydrolase